MLPLQSYVKGFHLSTSILWLIYCTTLIKMSFEALTTDCFKNFYIKQDILNVLRFIVGIDKEEKNSFGITKEKFSSEVRVFVNGGFM